MEREQRAVIDPASVIGDYFQQPALNELVEDFVREQVDNRLAELTQKQLVLPAPTRRLPVPAHPDSRRVYEGLLKRARATSTSASRLGRPVNRDRSGDRVRGDPPATTSSRPTVTCAARPDRRPRASCRSEAPATSSPPGRRAFDREATWRQPRTSSSRPRRCWSRPMPRRLALFPEPGRGADPARRFRPRREPAPRRVRDRGARRASGARRQCPSSSACSSLLLSGSTRRAGPAATKAAEDAIELCERAGDELGLARAWRLLAWMQARPFGSRNPHRSLEQAIECARRAGDIRQERRASTQYAADAVYGPTPSTKASAAAWRSQSA